jgi:hypothetical protein
MTVGVKQAPRYRRHVTHNQFSCSQPSEYRGPTPSYRPVITPDCAFMMIRWWWYNERTRHLSPQSKHRRCLQVFLLISVNNPTKLFFLTQLSILNVTYYVFKTHRPSNIIKECCRVVGNSESDSGLSNLESWLGELISWLKFFVFLLRSSREMLG